MQSRSFHFPMPKEVQFICDTIARAGERAYVVGGAVRDMLTGRSVVDFDLATTASPDTVTKLFRKVIPTGIKHGTVTVLLEKRQYEVTTLRGEGAYSDGRRPDHVEFLKDIEADLARRDFTINAMAWDPIQRRLHDPFDGRKDLESRVIRAVGDPAERFREDGLRVLRAARFAATLQFDVEPHTLDAMPTAAPALAKVSNERKKDELVKLLGAEKPSRGLRTMHQSNLIAFVLPELFEIVKTAAGQPVWQNTLKRVDGLPPKLRLRLAGLLYDMGGDVDLSSGERSAKLAKTWLRSMKFENRLIEIVPLLLREDQFQYQLSWSDTQIRQFMRRVGEEHLSDLLELHRANLATRPEAKAELNALPQLVEKVQQFAENHVPLTIKALDIGGNELIAELGLESGPEVGKLLEMLLDHVLENPQDNTRPRLLQQARRLVSRVADET